MTEKNTIVLDSENCAMGRVAAFAAKKALQGDSVAIVNCDKAVISGNKANIVENYLVLRRRTNVRFPSNTEQIFKRTIRGMIGYKKGRGEKALKEIKCYKSVPGEFKNAKMIKIGERSDGLKLEELSKMLK